MPDLAPIYQAIRKVQLRLRLQSGLEWVATGAVLGLLVSLISMSLGRLAVLSADTAWYGVLFGLMLSPLGLVVGLLRPAPALSAAKLIDVSHGLKDRFSSAIDFAGRQEIGSFEELSMRETVSFAGEVRAKKAAPLSAPRDLAGVFGLSAALFVVAMLRFPSAQVAPEIVALKPLAPVIVDPFDLAQQKEKAKQLLQEAQDDGDKQTAALAEKLVKIWDAVEKGELTQEEALRQLAALEKSFADAAKQKAGLEQAASELAKAFEKNPKTKDLADALKNQDFEKAAQEIEKLAGDLDKMTPKEREDMQKALEQAAKAAEEMSKEPRELDKDDPDQAEDKKTPEEQEAEDKKRELDKCAALDDTATPEEKAECDKKFDEKDLEDKRRELQKDERKLEQLRKEEKEKKEQEEQKRQLEKLSRDMKKAAEDLASKLTPEQKDALKKASEEMKKMGQQQRYAKRQESAAGKMGDAKNVIIRGGQGQSGQAKDFRNRAGGKNGQGQQGQGQQGQGGQGQQPGQGKDGQQPGQGGQGGKGGQGDTYVIDLDHPGQGDTQIELPGLGDQPGGQGDQPGDQQGAGDQPGDQPGGKGKEPGGENYGTGSVDDPFGRSTSLDVNFKDEKLQGRQGAGPSNVEVIEKVAQSGLVGAQYKKVYKDASREAEDSLEREEIPVGYKRFVKRYFDLIQPQ